MKKISSLKALMLLIVTAILHVGALGQVYFPVTVTHYDLSLDIRNFSQKTLYGKAVISILSREDQSAVVQLNLLGMSIDSVKMDNELLQVDRSGDTIRIALPQPMAAGQQAFLSIWYQGTPTIEPYNWGGFHFDNGLAYNLGIAFEADPHNYGRCMFPCIDEFHERATYDYHITTDTNMYAVCGGTMQGVDHNGDGSLTYHWQMAQSVPAYLASVAVSSYLPREDVFVGQEREIPIGLHFKASDSTRVKALFSNLKAVTAGFEAAWGPYPFDRIGFCGTNKGAMEHAANVAYPVGSLGAENEWLWAHELSHMWFGDMVTCANAEEMWLNEGWAVFNEYLTQEILYGNEAYDSYLKNKHRDVISGAHLADGGYRALVGIPTEYTYGETVYQKGGLVAHALRWYLGDEKFFPAVRAWLQHKKFNHATSVELRDFLSQQTGVDLTGFFDGWVFNPGFPAFVVDSMQIVPDGYGWKTKGFVQQKLRDAPAFFTQNRVPVLLYDSTGRFQGADTVDVSGQTAVFEITTGIKPAWALVDPDIRVPTAMTTERRTVKSTGTIDFSDTYFKLIVNALVDSAVVHVSHYRVAPDPLKTPVDGWVLSNFRFWQVKGCFPEGFDATGRFTYSKSLHIDDSLLVSSADSLMLLYRPDASCDWQLTDAVKQGTAFAGAVLVNHLKPGDYVLAIKKFGTGIGQLPVRDSQKLKVFPNPSDGWVTLETGYQDGMIEIFNLLGECVLRKDVDKMQHHFLWQSPLAGTYLVRFVNFKDHSSDVVKFEVID